MWIEILIKRSKILAFSSQPARAVWIEIYYIRPGIPKVTVTACEGCVD